MTSNPDIVKERMLKIFDDALRHNGFSEFRVEIRILKKQQKEVIIHYGRQYRYVLDFMNEGEHKKPLYCEEQGLI